MDEKKIKSLTDCYYYITAECTKDDCEFRHCEASLTNVKICKFWLENKCKNEVCMFRHPPVVTPIDRSKTVCFWFSQPGGCKKGEACLYMHPSHMTNLMINTPTTSSPISTSTTSPSTPFDSSNFTSSSSPASVSPITSDASFNLASPFVKPPTITTSSVIQLNVEKKEFSPSHDQLEHSNNKRKDNEPQNSLQLEKKRKFSNGIPNNKENSVIPQLKENNEKKFPSDRNNKSKLRDRVT